MNFEYNFFFFFFVFIFFLNISYFLSKRFLKSSKNNRYI